MSVLGMKIIACTAMLIDHIGYLWGISVFRGMGRIAFPVFLYLIYNGYRHTKSPVRYALRLGVFAVLSQIPFSLLLRGEVFAANLNVFFSLLLTLLCIWSADVMKSRKTMRYLCPLPFALSYVLYLFGVFQSDNGIAAVILGAVFFFFDGDGAANKIAVTAGMIAAKFHGYILAIAKYAASQMHGTPKDFPVPSNWEMMQIYALFSLCVIFSYNGKKGRMPQNPAAAKAVQYGFYLFYPLHMTVLYVIHKYI